MMEYFSNSFKSKGSDNDPIISKVSKKLVSESQNNLLFRPFEAYKIKDALFSMHLDKSPGLDGMNPGFSQSYWDIVGGDVTTVCLTYLNNRSLIEELNTTSIVLISKKGNPEKISDLRPIALRNVLYKIVSKAIANRLKAILPSVVSEFQSAFILGRLITDNIMIAFEVCHHLK